MERIYVVGWDHDKVAIPDLTTSVLARASPLQADPYLKEFVEERKWFTYSDVDNWEQRTSRKVRGQKVGALADMLTDFLYKDRKADGNSVITKQQTIEGKQYLLRGLSVNQVREIIGGVPFTDGLRKTVMEFRTEDVRRTRRNEVGLKQTLYSDGLGLAVDFQVVRLELDAGGGVPAILEPPREEADAALKKAANGDFSDMVLSGSVEPFEKWKAFSDYVNGLGLDMASVAVIDDSGTNVQQMKKVQEAGGIAVAFNPTDPHRNDFEKAGIPILKGVSLEPFAEIVLADSSNREAVIGRYCV